MNLLNNPRFRNLIGLHSPSRAVLDQCTCRRCWDRSKPRPATAAETMRVGFDKGITDVHREMRRTCPELLPVGCQCAACVNESSAP